MDIGLLAVDSGYPNLALMKIARWHKERGDSVEWYNQLCHYDKAYLAKVFTFTPDYGYYLQADEVEKGGTGYDIGKRLQEEIDRLQPDYSLYPSIDGKTAYGNVRGIDHNRFAFDFADFCKKRLHDFIFSDFVFLCRSQGPFQHNSFLLNRIPPGRDSLPSPRSGNTDAGNTNLLRYLKFSNDFLKKYQSSSRVRTVSAERRVLSGRFEKNYPRVDCFCVPGRIGEFLETVLSASLTASVAEVRCAESEKAIPLQNKKPRSFERGNCLILKSGLLSNRAFQFGIVRFADKLRQIGSVVIFRFDSIAFLNAFGGLSLVDDFFAVLFSDLDFGSLLYVVKLHDSSPC